MTKTRMLSHVMAGALGAVLLCSAGARAQDNNNSLGLSESVTALGQRGIQLKQLFGNFDGEVNPQQISMSRTISYGDLDLSRNADRDILHDRIASAAHDMCDRLADAAAEDRQDVTCFDKAVQNAMLDVDNHTG